ncbi:MAG: hypothetical protein LBK76_08650 [Verrucomicrobiales bacterium]|nr:hypothetical protein [Verrucomicrobiales bacterium]
MKFIKHSIPALLALMLVVSISGCTSVPMADDSAQAEALKLTPPPVRVLAVVFCGGVG